MSTSVDDDGNAWALDVEASEDSAPWVPPGRYDAIVIRGDVHKYRWTDHRESRRFVLKLEIINNPLAAGIVLQFICELPRKAGSRSKFMRAWEVANGGPAKRRDRLKLSVFRSRMFSIDVGDVDHDRNQIKLAKPYAVVRALVERLA